MAVTVFTRALARFRYRRNHCSPLGVVVFPPEGIVGFVHEHAVLEEHGVHEPPEEEKQGKHEEELPVGPGDDGDEHRHQEQVEECALR